MTITEAQLEAALEHLQTAIAILQGDRAEPARNPEWFRDTGHLSDKGIEHLHRIFASGRTVYSAAKEMGISYRATALRHADWQKKHQKKT